MSLSPKVAVNLSLLPDGPISLEIRPRPNPATDRFVELVLKHTRGINSDTVIGKNGSYKFWSPKLVTPSYAREVAYLLVSDAVSPVKEVNLEGPFKVFKANRPTGSTDYPDDDIPILRSLLANRIHVLRQAKRWPEIGPLRVEPVKTSPGSPVIDLATNYRFTSYDLPDLKTTLGEDINEEASWVKTVELQAGGHELLIGINDFIKRGTLKYIKAGLTEPLRQRVLAMAGSQDEASLIPSH